METTNLCEYAKPAKDFEHIKKLKQEYGTDKLCECHSPKPCSKQYEINKSTSLCKNPILENIL